MPEPEPEINFDNFWLLYPRHEAKKDAKKAWSQMPIDEHLTALVAIVPWRRIFLLRDTHHIPLAGSWIRGERYFDELPTGVVASASSHVAFEKDSTPRGVMPQFVKDAIARQRGQR